MVEPPDPLPMLRYGDGIERDALRLREAGAEELAALIDEQAGGLEPPAVLQVLRNPHCTLEIIERLAAEQRLLAYYEVRRGLTLHPRTPEALALRFVTGLHWRDLMELGLDTRLRPTLRRAADLRLIARLPELALGEKLAIARRAGTGVLAQLRHDPSPRVAAALLDNPRLTEGLLEPLVNSVAAAPAVLEVIAADRRWGARYALRLALARNPATPVVAAWRILGTLRKPDLKLVAGDPRLTEAVRRRAWVLLEEKE
jgi:hypothetical protein